MKEVIKKVAVKGVDTVRGKELINEDFKALKEREEREEEEKKSLNERIEDLVNEMEKNNFLIAKIYSLRSAFFRGLLQGLGIIIGSTILAGALYSLGVHMFGKDFLKDVVLDDVIQKYSQEK